MQEGVYLAFDVGGTYIKAGALDGDGRILGHVQRQYEAKANGTATEIIDHLAAVVLDVLQLAAPSGAGRLLGIGYAFPGPFDYEQGISYIRGLDKFDALYGMPVAALLKERLHAYEQLAGAWTSETVLRFENDAALFTLGEAHYGKAAGAPRAVCLTIGTGIGSGFTENGKLITGRPDVPRDGWVYRLPYRSGIADDFISRRGLLSLAAEIGVDVAGRDVKELAEEALRGDTPTAAIFEAFGRRMADILEQPLRAFRPNVVVLGGQISRSGTLFAPAFTEELRLRGVSVSVACSENTWRSVMQGIYHSLCNGTDSV
jgi:glucokinase